MNKCIRIKLIPREIEGYSYQEIKDIIWKLQNEARLVANKTVQVCWEDFIFDQEYFKENGEYPSKEVKKEHLNGKTLMGVAYNVSAEISEKLQKQCVSAISRMAVSKFQKEKKNYLKGDKSIPSYRRNLPIEIPKPLIFLNYDNSNGEWGCELALIALGYKKELNLKVGRLPFKMIVRDRSSRRILERIYDGVYDIAGSKLTYDKGQCFLLLGYAFDNELTADKSLKEGNICGVYIGEYNSVYATTNVNNEELIIRGREVERFRIQVEKKRKELRKSTVYCSDGNVGHGRKKRIKRQEDLSRKISNFKNLTNFKYSKAIVDFAKKNNCKTIVIEDLKGVSEQCKQLKNWSYFDLQQKIKNRCIEAGIDVVVKKITEVKRERGAIAESKKCTFCGFEEYWDYSRSRTLCKG